MFGQVVHPQKHRMMIPELHSKNKFIPNPDRHRMQQQARQIDYSLEYLGKETTMPQNSFLHNNVIEKLNQLSIVKNKPHLIQSKRQMQDLSLIPVIRTIIIENIHYLAQIQYEYDHFQKSLIKLANGQRVSTFLNKIMQKKKIEEIFNDLKKSQIQRNPLSYQVCQKLIKPIFVKVFEVLKIFAFQISMQVLLQIFWNYDVDLLIIGRQQFENEQTLLMKQALKDFAGKRQTNQENLSKDTLSVIGNHLIQRKKKTKDQNLFWSQIEPSNYPNHIYEDINMAYKEQILTISNLSREKLAN